MPGPDIPERSTDGAGELERYGCTPRWTALFDADEHAGLPGARLGRVVRHDGVAVLVVTEDGTAQLPWRRALEPVPVVGDWVVATPEVVEAVLPRATLLRRQDPRAEIEQPLVANLDVVLITCGADRPISAGRIQRAAAVAWDAGAVPVLVLTKADLTEDLEAALAELDGAATGAEIVVTSALADSTAGDAVDADSTSGTGAATGIERVRALVAGRTVVLLGESGAGKSTLANALAGEEVAATGAVRGADHKGRHTTTSRQLHPLRSGGVLVDTPGIRSVGVWADEDDDLTSAAYADLDELTAQCRFSDCAHEGEPGCAIAAALASGDLPRERHDAWQALLREEAAAALRAVEHERRAQGKRFARITKEAVRRKGGS